MKIQTRYDKGSELHFLKDNKYYAAKVIGISAEEMAHDKTPVIKYWFKIGERQEYCSVEESKCFETKEDLLRSL